MEDLLEREAEVAAIHGALRAAADGHGRMVVVEGPGGIGKSRLLLEARHRAAADGRRVLTARCSELERSFPFGAVRQLFEPLLLAPDGDRDALLGGAAQLAAPLISGAASAELDEESLFSRLHGLYWLLANLTADRPVLLAVDDAHWADEASLRFLAFLAPRIADLPAVLAIGSRPVDDPSADPAVGTLLTDPEALHLRPSPLSEAAVAAWLDRDGEGPDAAFVAACRETTGGNPFLLRELISAIADEGLEPRGSTADRVRWLGPSGVATTILLRLRRLAPAAVDLSRALAILGDGIDPRAAGAFAGLDDATAIEAARVLEAAGIAEAEHGLRFVHPIVRQSVYQDLGAVERGEGHAAAAAFLAERDAPADVIAAHLLNAPPRGDAATVAALRQAAAQAEALGDPIAAGEHLRRALAEPPADEDRAEVLFALGRAEARAGLTSAADHLQACLALRPPAEIYVPAAGFLTELLQFSGQSERAVDVLERGIAEFGEESDVGRRLAANLVAPAHVSIHARRRVLRRIAGFTEPPADATGSDAFVVLIALGASAIMDRNDGRTATEYCRRALAIMPAGQDPAVRSMTFALAVALMGAEDFALADRVLTDFLDTARRTGARASACSIVFTRALVRYRSGHVASAEADAALGLELLPEAHGAEMLAHAGTAAAVLAGIEAERPRAVLEAYLDDTAYTRDPDILPYSQILLARGTLLQVHGHHEEALRCLLACDRDEPGWAGGSPSMVWWRSAAALSLSALGRDDEAVALAAEEVRLAHEAQTPRAAGMAERAAALVGPADEREAGLSRAVATLERSGVPLELARALVDLGGELRRTGDRSGARDALNRAHDLAERVGAERLARAARQELRGLGARPRSTGGHGVTGLTPAERRVADLAADGRTNREIAQSLFVSEKTVETHLARVYRKLGVTSRRNLPDALAR